MKSTKQDVLDAVIIFGNKMGKKEQYEALIKAYELPRLVQVVAYDIFVNDINQYFESDTKVFYAISLLKNYAKELEKKGFVEFEKK